MADNEALFTPELVFFDWGCATPDEVFARLEGKLAPRGYIADGWLDAVLTREDAYPTGLAMPAANIAIPHTDPGFVAKPYIAVVKPAAPVTFNAMAGIGAPGAAPDGTDYTPNRRRSSSIWVLPSRAARSRPCRHS